MRTEGEDKEIRCKLGDVVWCKCGQESQVGQMIEENPEVAHTTYEPFRAFTVKRELQKAGYHRCPHCGEYLVYDRGDGTMMLSDPDNTKIIS